MNARWTAAAAVILAFTLGSDPAPGGQALAAAGGSAALVVGEGEARLEAGDGSVLRLPWPSRTLASTIDATDGGWLVSGYRAAVGEPPRLYFLSVEQGGARPLAAPAPASPGARQIHPLPFVDEGALVGAVWLEGQRDDALGVRAAVWDGARFGTPRWVSPPRRGSQLALAGAVLGDGSWLLAWTAFDGQDDEVFWSRRVGSAWQPAARVEAEDDAWPDITPALTASPGGALLAWSGYDGQTYRTVVARFSGHGWERPSAIGGAGTLYPAFRGSGEPPLLLLFDAAARAWEVLELDRRGQPRRRATLPALAGDETPLLASAEPDAEGVALRWPGLGRRARAPWRNLR